MALCIAEILEESRIPLRNFIRKRVANEEDVNDILQDVSIKLLSNIDKLFDSQKINAWIYKITRNAITDYYRKNHNYMEFDSLPVELSVVPDEDFSSNHEIASCLKNMVNNLPGKYKEAIILTAFENHTIKEYSEMAGISLSGAKSRVQRARCLLKEVVFKCCSLEFDRLGNIINYKKRSSDCKYC